jgi:hypothetical protein
MPTVDEVIAARVRADIAEKMLEMLQALLCALFRLGQPRLEGPGP